MQIFAQAAAEAEAVRVDLQVSNVSVSHPQLLIIDDKSAAANMDMVIDAIGEVTLDSAEKINDARELYDSLTAAQKKLVTKYAALQAAEAKLRALRDQVNAQFTKYAFAEYTTEIMTVDGELKEVIWRTPLTIFGSGLIPNLIHGVATALTLLLLAKPMMEKLNRMKTKYGMMDSESSEWEEV